MYIIFDWISLTPLRDSKDKNSEKRSLLPGDTFIIFDNYDEAFKNGQVELGNAFSVFEIPPEILKILLRKNTWEK